MPSGSSARQPRPGAVDEAPPAAIAALGPAALGRDGRCLQVNADRLFYFLPVDVDYVSNFLSGFPRSLSLRTVLKHKTGIAKRRI